MNQRTRLPDWMRRSSRAGIVLLAAVVLVQAQDSSSSGARPQSDEMAQAVRDLQQQVKELRDAVAEVRAEAAQYRAETSELRKALEQAHSGAAVSGEKGPSPEAGEESLTKRVAALEDSTQLTASRVDQQYQTKVESASKYRVRLSGMVLMNLFSNRGVVDNQDVPNVVNIPSVLDSQGTIGATVRQSEVGLEVFGPDVFGAKTSGEVHFDFAGGFPNELNGANYGLVRLRTGTMRLDWEHTSVIAGQDGLFLSPLSPTSYASLAVPAFGYSGNLWSWVPQVRVEHRFDLPNDQSLLVQGGILDNFAGEPPYSSSMRLPTSGEKAGQPAFGTRVAWRRSLHGQPLTLGAAGYYSRQNWDFDRYTDGWAGMVDLEIPMGSRLELTGEFYRGRAIGGLGGGVGRSVLFSGAILQPTSQVLGVNAAGGWSQLKFRATEKLEFNGAFGLDNPYSKDLHTFAVSQSYYDPSLAQNRSALINFVYRPKSNLLFSTEYRHLRTFRTSGNDYAAEHINVSMGVLF